MTTYTLRKGSPATTRTDVVVVGVARDAKGGLVVCPGGEDVASAYGRKFAPLLASMGFTARSGEVLRIPAGEAVKAATLVLVGLGERDRLSLQEVRRGAGVAARNVANAATVAVALPAGDAAHVGAVANGFMSGGYEYSGYKSGEAASAPTEVILLSEVARRQDAAAAMTRARVLAELTDHVRDWVNTPANDFTPSRFADAVEELTTSRKDAGVTLEVLGVRELEELGCGGILGVGLGSANPPRMARLSWRHEAPVASVALVGKGVTYDSGGLTIKPGGSMATMKNDMAGAAAVVAAIHAIATLNLPVAVEAFAPMAENMISGSAMRPGDVIRTHGGKTVEITNTDAEGRLLLADALGMAAETRPDVILEISTLTGPCVVALGDRVAGLFGDDGPVTRMRDAAETAGELVWHLPIPERIEEQVRTESRLADVLQHNWVRWGSASYAAAFLRQFVGDVPFAHLDVAGPAWNNGAAWGDVPRGATGFGVRTLVEYVAALARPAGEDLAQS
ncbi:leucyl aminopeptidase [Nocardioides terrisoli]|uniref:leucyl aminopeptidase n=1 Tax=Nocardioides terrisoli TaxID=3388267 RepID=UPI00287B8D9A|nr:leucyl aminopeptidase [Nocardioides marmorisolisilvae]